MLQQTPPDGAAPVIDFAGVGHEYRTPSRPPVRALDDIDFSVGPGEFVSVVGPSGCGKSTLLRLAVGLATPTAGRVAVFGEQVKGPQPDVGMIFQDAVMLPWLTVLQNVLLPVRIAKGDMRRGTTKARALLDSVGLGGFDGALPHHLSGGMRQRAAIVRALMTEPRILLMDEPFGALDALTREQMNVDLAQIAEDSGCAVLLITHGISEAVFLGDRVVVISPRPGRVAEIIDVPLPRPRRPETLQHPRFNEICDQVRAHFRHDDNKVAFNHD